MNVVRHEHVSVHFDVELHGRRASYVQEQAVIRTITEHRSTVVAALNDVVTGAR